MQIKINLDGVRDYFVNVGEVGRLEFDSNVCVVTNDVVAPLYLEKLKSKIYAKRLISVVLPDGEANKTYQSIEQITNALFEAKFDRHSTLIALGGGVVSDLTGFAAAIYQRGINFVSVATTLLAQVDASVGGKTGFNNKFGKNLLGAFWQPKAVWCDSRFLATLNRREFSAGVAEAVKMAVIFEREFFADFEEFAASNGDDLSEFLVQKLAANDSEAINFVEKVVQKSVQIKAKVVSQDETESGVRAALNYGHTFAHGIEKLAGYGTLLHGEAVSVGIVIANDLAVRLGLLSRKLAARIRGVLEAFSLPVSLKSVLKNTTAEELYESFLLDKKNENGEIKFILATQEGANFAPFGVKTSVKKDEVLAVLNAALKE